MRTTTPEIKTTKSLRRNISSSRFLWETQKDLKVESHTCLYTWLKGCGLTGERHESAEWPQVQHEDPSSLFRSLVVTVCLSFPRYSFVIGSLWGVAWSRSHHQGADRTLWVRASDKPLRVLTSWLHHFMIQRKSWGKWNISASQSHCTFCAM